MTFEQELEQLMSRVQTVAPTSTTNYDDDIVVLKGKVRQLKESAESSDRTFGQSIDRIESEVNKVRNRKIDRSDLTPNFADFLDKLNEARPVRLELPNFNFVSTSSKDGDGIENFQKMLDDLLLGNNIFLVGPAGTGKTFTAEALCRKGWGEPKDKMVELNCSQWTAPRDIVGGDTIDGYKEGRLIDAWENGKLLVLDELPKLDPNTAGLLNDALAKTANRTAGKTPTIRTGDGRVVKKHDRFACVATGNITGKRSSPKYKGNNTQDGSLIDRFVGSYYYIGFNEALEASLTVPFVFKVYKALRDALMQLDIENDITLRGMLNANRTYILEMERECGFVDQIKGGKTIADNVTSYLSLHDEDARKLIERNGQVSLLLGMLKNAKYKDTDGRNAYKVWRSVNTTKVIEATKN